VKFVPVRVTGTAVPRRPDTGLIAVSVGAGGATTVNGRVLVSPAGVERLTFLTPVGALGPMLKVPVTVVEFTTTKLVAVMRLPNPFPIVAPVRFVPVKVTLTLVPCAPVLGAIEVRVGPNTVNVTALLVPFGVVTVTFLVVSPAVVVIEKVAMISESLTTVIEVTVTPAPETFTEVAPARATRSLPIKVTATFVPRSPVLGVIEDSFGPLALFRNSTAPTSNLFGTAGSGLGLPKKSVLGVTAKVGELVGMASIIGEPAAGS
jgi:hypothetical protein